MSGLAEKYGDAIVAFHAEVTKFLESSPVTHPRDDSLEENTYQLGIDNGVIFMLSAFSKHCNVVRKLIADELMHGKVR